MAGFEKNGRAIYKNDDLGIRIIARVNEYKAKKIPYPSINCDDYYAYQFVWFNRIPYDTATLNRLSLRKSQQLGPIILPDDFIIDGETQLPGETKSQYAKYLVYRDQGPSRSLNQTARLLGGKKEAENGERSYMAGYSRDLPRLCGRFRWAERCAAYDGMMETKAIQTQEQILQDKLAEFAVRKDLYLEAEYETIVGGMEAIKEMLAYPRKQRRISKADGTTIIIEPVKWTMASLAQLIEAITKLGRLHTGLTPSPGTKPMDPGVHRGSEQEIDPEDLAAHEYASQKAEEAYFLAYEEYKHRQANPKIAATIVESTAEEIAAAD